MEPEIRRFLEQTTKTNLYPVVPTATLENDKKGTMCSRERAISLASYVTVAKASKVMDVPESVIRRKIIQGKWLDGREYRRSPDGGIFISIKGCTS